MSLNGGAILGLVRDTLGVFDRVLGPLLLLGVRLWLAMIFLDHGLDAAGQAPDRVFGIDPQATTEIVAAVLLALGLLTRLAAIPIAFLSLAVYFGDQNVAGHVMCALLAFALTVHGPGPSRWTRCWAAASAALRCRLRTGPTVSSVPSRPSPSRCCSSCCGCGWPGCSG